jgi:peptide deformylase
LKSIKDILQLGNPLLYEVSEPVLQSELSLVPEWVNDLDNVLQEVRAQYKFGRAIAAPQLGIKKRLIYLNIDKPVVIINPHLSQLSYKMIELWDDCMCFPNLLVKVERHKSLTIKYLDQMWQQQEWNLKDDLAELLQHEYDHLDGKLCTMRAIDNKSFKLRRID